MTESIVDKNIIHVNIYKFKLDSVEYEFETYTAIWCKPCMNIKPKIMVYLEDLLECEPEIKLVSNYNMDKTCYKKEICEFVPFFRIRRVTDSDWSSIQTSDFEKFKDFLDIVRNTKKWVPDDEF